VVDKLKYMLQGAQLFGRAGEGGGAINFMNMSALIVGSSGGGGGTMGMPNAAAGAQNKSGSNSLMGMVSTVTPRVSDASSIAGGSVTGSSMAGSMS